jgi:hypothetical protein
VHALIITVHIYIKKLLLSKRAYLDQKHCISSRELIPDVVFQRVCAGSEGNNRESSARRRHVWAVCLGLFGSTKGNLVNTAGFDLVV